MMHFLHGLARAVAETFDLPGPVLEIGSYQVEGQETIADLRPFFPGKTYVGMDMRPGPGVDLVGDVEGMPQADASVGTVIAMSTFEHVRHFWKGFAEVERVLRPDGVLLVSCPFYFRIHSYPSDYWRFTPMALEVLLENYPSKIIGWHGPRKKPANVWAVAFREGRPPITAAQHERYKRLLHRYAHEPMRMDKVVRYRVGGLLCGGEPFSPYLEMGKWESECLNGRRS